MDEALIFWMIANDAEMQGVIMENALKEMDAGAYERAARGREKAERMIITARKYMADAGGG